jgi:hypothetical protein
MSLEFADMLSWHTKDTTDDMKRFANVGYYDLHELILLHHRETHCQFTPLTMVTSFAGPFDLASVNQLAADFRKPYALRWDSDEWNHLDSGYGNRVSSSDNVNPELAELTCLRPQNYTFRNFQGTSEQSGTVLQPYTLTTMFFQILTDLYGEKLTIETHTPVLGVSYEGSRLSHRYTVTTSRGEVRANHVIYCTNGWTSHLLPNLAEKIFPWRTTMTCQEFDYNLLSGPQPVGRPACAFREASGPVHNYDNSLVVLGRDHITELGPTNRAYFNRLLIRSDALHYDTLIDDDDTWTFLNARDHVSVVLRNLITDEDLALQAHSRDQETWSGVCGYTAGGIPISGKLSKEWTG